MASIDLGQTGVEPQISVPVNATRRGRLQDCLFLASVLAISAAAYLPGLGLYTDDWAFFSTFRFCSDQSTSGLFRCLYAAAPETRVRPVQIFCLSVLYRVFGVRPLAYHFFSLAALIVAVLLLYLTLREFAVPRLTALAVPLLYALIPHYSTDRFWIASLQANVSMAFCFLAFYCALRAASEGERSHRLWRAGAVVALLMGAFAYEVCVPLFVLIPILYVLQKRRTAAASAGFYTGLLDRRSLRFASIWIAALTAVCAVKLVAQSRVKFAGRFLHHLPATVHHAMVQTIQFNFGYYGLGLPAVAWNALAFYSNLKTMVLGVILALAVVSYLLLVAWREPWKFGRVYWWKLAGIGLVVYLLGYLPFFAYLPLNWTSADMDNRVAIAAATGAAMIICALLGILSGIMRPPKASALLFCVLITLFGVSGFLIVNAIGGFWVKSYQKQQNIVSSIRESFPVWPQRTALILGGACPSIGPAPVFEFDYDLAGALQFAYNTRKLRADVVNPSMRIGPNSLSSETWGWTDHYNYGEQLILFDAEQQTVQRLTNQSIARRLLAISRAKLNQSCQIPRAPVRIYPFRSSGRIKGFKPE